MDLSFMAAQVSLVVNFYVRVGYMGGVGQVQMAFRNGSTSFFMMTQADMISVLLLMFELGLCVTPVILHSTVLTLRGLMGTLLAYIRVDLQQSLRSLGFLTI